MSDPRWWVALAVTVRAVALAGCGGSGKPNASASSSNATAQGIKFADRMRSHGVPSFPDPSFGGPVIRLGKPGLNPASPVSEKAAETGRGPLPGGGQVTAVAP